MASGRLHGPALHLLRAYTSHPLISSTTAQTGLTFGQLAIPASTPYAVSACPSLAQGTPERASRQVDGFIT